MPLSANSVDDLVEIALADVEGMVRGTFGGNTGRRAARAVVEYLLTDGHLHCDGDPIECGVQAMQGELAECRRQLKAAHAEVARLERELACTY